ncbi:sterol carrier family protein [Actinomadura alba]|uniref:Bacterial SCP orthologue domain-containing protein n=1 Tax=Actinomadura alba TaxID=406431 RepID=A0ABR7LQ78_9ACTN|nr:sterol carrier family protein [Actinomadura alba]MBC6466971.1 hypothetical protein [Actinomadura alba]
MSRTQLTRAVLDAQLAALGRPPYAGPDDPAALRRGCLDAVLAAREAGTEPQGAVLKGAVRHLLDRLVAIAPGRSVEVRIPPYAAAQCVEGPRHTRGTPPNVVEMGAATWIGLATGAVSWADAVENGEVRASGARADLREYLPLHS